MTKCDPYKDKLIELPWKIGSGMVKGKYSGYFFCAKIGDQTFLRFVPENAKKPDDIIEEIGTCLRIIECTEKTEYHLPEKSYEN